ncbi:MAG TPA: cyclic nucleotide-binding domain-containing protein [Jatrophihabitantaceae bacterium]|nr:cyclic nucleotide-binding domain-containing protein [Jatrophihabitantaceae bacterium]
MLHGEKRRIADQLAQSAAWAGCPRADVDALVAAGGETSFPDGWPFVREGTPADACYVLLSGTARVFLGRQEIAVLGIGDIIGEGALLEGGQRSATVAASSPCKALRVEYEALRELLRERPQLRDKMIAVYRSRHPDA